MPRIAGIATKKDLKGNITHVTINVKKHKESIMPLLHQLGVIEKTKFQLECEEGSTIEETWSRLHNKIDSLWSK